MDSSDEIIIDYSIYDAKEEVVSFLSEKTGNEEKKEYLLSILVDKLIKTQQAKVKMLTSDDRWFGVTYAEDKESVMDSFKELIAAGVYDEQLWK